MSPRPHEGPAEEGLSSSLLQIAHDPERLDRLRSILSGFCHRCRNSLNGIKMSLYLFRREARGAVPDCWGELEAIYHQVEHLFDHLQTIYRPMALAMVRSPLDELMGHHGPKWRSWFESRGRALELDAPESEVCGEFDPAQLGVGLDAMASWRAEAGEVGTLTRIGWEVRDGWIEIRWLENDAPGRCDPVEFGCAGGKREASPSSRCVDALALPLLARIIAAHGGRVRCVGQPSFGLSIGWPQSQQPASPSAATALDGDRAAGITCPSAPPRGA